MAPPRISLPDGYRLQFHKTVDSTNSEALRLAEKGETPNLWVLADAQSAGRGRAGREWASLNGNLFASLLINVDCAPRNLPELGFVAGVALHDTVRGLVPRANDLDVALKWPNDLLHNGKKIAGLLLESMPGGKDRLDAVVGFGLNVNRHPPETSLPATSLAAEGISATRDAAMEALAIHFCEWREVWNNGSDFSTIRTAWLDRSIPMGSAISVNTANEIHRGIFSGIDDDGALRLRLDDKSEKRITAGDIFPL